MVRVTCIADFHCVLGEGPVWDESVSMLWFVDIKAPSIHRLDPVSGEVESWPMPERVGALTLREAGGLLVSLKTGFHTFDPSTGGLHLIGNPEPQRPDNRLNDAKCDARGRYWAGSMDDEEKAPTGHLYRLDPDGQITRFEAGFTVTNGPAFSPDWRTMYFADSDGRTIYAYAFDLDSGAPSGRRVFATVPEGEGFPDGMTCDLVGGLWSAHWEGSRLTRYTPDGKVDRVVDIPAPRVTSCAFGGADGDVLYVTTARVGLDEARLAQFPLSGGVFAVTGLGLKGDPMPRFAG